MQGTLCDERYQLERRLGNGGMATVYLARDPKLGRRVAVKLLADNFADDRDARRRFEREARLAAKLDHPNVVQVFDVGEDEGTPFIVMEHVEGGTLADVVSRRGPRKSRALDLFEQACAGLEHAHEKGLVHRDIKPQNLLIADDGRVKIADFGIARTIEEKGVTQTGQVLGTKPYMAPEQLEGRKLTPATDVYALGVVGYELFGRRPPAGVAGVLRRCSEPDPKQRFADAGEVRRALGSNGDGPAANPDATTRVLTERPRRRTRPTIRMERTAPTRRRERARPGLDLRGNRRVAAVLGLFGAALVVIALVLGAGGGGGDSSPEAPSPVAKPAPQLADPAEQGHALADWLRARGGQ